MQLLAELNIIEMHGTGVKISQDEADHLLPSTTKAKNEVSALTETNDKTTVFLDVTSCSLVDVYRCIKGICSLHPSGKSGQHIPPKQCYMSNYMM